MQLHVEVEGFGDVTFIRLSELNQRYASVLLVRRPDCVCLHGGRGDVGASASFFSLFSWKHMHSMPAIR